LINYDISPIGFDHETASTKGVDQETKDNSVLGAIEPSREAAIRFTDKTQSKIEKTTDTYYHQENLLHTI
jgi:hypothetical protein